MKSNLIVIGFVLIATNLYGQTWSGTTPGNIYYNAGNVGIGTSSPSSALSLYRETGNADLSITTNSNSGQTLMWFRNNPTAQDGMIIYQSDGRLSFNLDIAGEGVENNEYLTITPGGNIGIGTIAPLSSLSVYRESGNVDLNLVTNLSSAQATMWFRNNPTGQDGMIIYQSDGRLSFNLDNSGSGVESNEYLTLSPNGNVGIGTPTPGSKLTVAGDIHSREVRVTIDAGSGPDFVFQEDYDLKTLKEVERFIQQNKHLPDIEPAREMEQRGVELGKMDMKLLQKVEELTLYLIEQNKKIEILEHRIKELEK